MTDDDPHDLNDAAFTKRKRRLSLILFLLFYFAVSALLIFVFQFFTHNWLLAILLVGFMTTYMSVMGWLAMRKAE